MARAEELVLAFLPVVRASEMGALRSERHDRVVGLLHDPGGALLAVDLPTVDAVAPERQLDGRVRRQLRDIARVDPLVLLADFRGKKR